MAVEVNNTTKARIDIKLVQKVTEKFLTVRRLAKKDVSIAFVSDARIRELNKAYRRLDKVTDVLSFAGEGNDLGEIIIDYRQIERQAKELKKSAKSELVFILVHGLLHLVGYDDDTEKKRLQMIKIAENFIKKINC